MTQDEMHKRTMQALENFGKWVEQASPEECRTWLIEHGFYNADGSLHKDYGGE